MAFTYDLSSDIGVVRFRIGDTINGQGPRPTGSNYSDEEIQHALTSQGSVENAVAYLLQVLTSEWSVVSDIQVGDRRENRSQVAGAFQKAHDLTNPTTGKGKTASVTLVRKDAYSE